MDVAARLKEARANLNLTLDAVSDRCGIARSALSEFENGKREPKLGQLSQLAAVYRRTVASFLEDIPASKQTVLWRERPSSPDAEQLQATLVDLALRYHNLELLCEQHSPMDLPVPKEFRGSYQEAQSLALRVRLALGLGDRPGQALLSVLEEDCNVKVFHLPFEPTGSAACTVSDNFGAAVLLNAKNARWRRNFDLAHELFHLLTWKFFRHDSAEGFEIAGADEERLAGCFASNLLMPEEVFRAAINSQRDACGKVGFDGLFEVARIFDVSIQAVIWRASSVFSISTDRAREVAENAKYSSRLYESRAPDQPASRPERFIGLCNQAIRNGLISTGRYADCLGITRREAMKFIEQDAEQGAEQDVEIEVADS